jgi:hypothetical protein
VVPELVFDRRASLDAFVVGIEDPQVLNPQVLYIVLLEEVVAYIVSDHEDSIEEEIE